VKKENEDREVLATGRYRAQFRQTPHVPHNRKASPLIEPTLHGLAELHRKQLALMHGSSFVGNGERALRDLAVVMGKVSGPGTEEKRLTG
jgi:hypothetical protein